VRPLNYTTRVPVDRTVHDCMAILAAAGADAVTIGFSGALPTGLSFTLKTPHGPRHFALPVRVAAVQKRIDAAVTADRPHVSAAQLARYRSPEHAAMVAWRVLRDWLAATLDMLATEAVSLDEVMLGWLRVGEVRGEPVTLYDNYREREQAALEAGG
jgi:hypothetical protein